MTITGRTEALRDFVREVISAIRDVDEHVLSSDYIKHYVLELENGAEPVGFDYSDPEAHFEDFDDIRFWEKYFSFVLREWNLDQHGERMGNSELNFLIERLTAPATQLDHYGPLLMAEYEKVPNAPAKRAQGISKRMAVLNGFLNSAEVALEVYYKKRSIYVKPTLRQRRPVRDANTTESGQQPDDTESSTPEPEARENSPRRKLLRKLFSGFTNNSTLITFVALFTIASAILSAYGYSVAIRTPKDLGWDSPEFYNTLQSALMQLLGLHWSWWLAGLGAIAPILAIGISYPVYDNTAADLGGG
ncbi:hypothetical protein EKO27_g3492 [Xylaria grammica]|uniref:Uncharacterized protein n=1 Tax=Xylaria grammica TaxID=363999 RepID=A0A439DB13_9PEZI|nr:hypothetical protein EKO27_g3492 [Xylaria grammica]